MAVSRSAPGLRRVGSGARRLALQDDLTIENVAAPSQAVPGDQLQVTALIRCRAIPGTDCESAARFTLGSQEVRVPTDGTRRIPEAGRERFNATLTMPQTSSSLVIEAIETGPFGREGVLDTVQHPIQAVTRQQNLLSNSLQFAPWAVAGSGIGGGIAGFRNSPVTTGVAAGAGAGVGAKLLVDQLGGVRSFIPQIPEFPTTAVLATAALLGAGAWFLGNANLDLGAITGEAQRGARAARRRLPSP